MLQLLKIQCEWYSFSVLVMVLSFGSWIGVAYIVSSSITIDYDYYFVSITSCDSLPLHLLRRYLLTVAIFCHSNRRGRGCCRRARSGCACWCW